MLDGIEWDDEDDEIDWMLHDDLNLTIYRDDQARALQSETHSIRPL